MILALAGNQNCGKTTLFNRLTGSNQHVGSFPGVTVDRKTGEVIGHSGCEVVDLPGIYSIRPYTNEEIVTRDFLIDEKPDAIINIVDATNIERNFYLTLQLIEMNIPMVLALNMIDEVRSNGGSVNVIRLSERLGIPVMPISAAKNEGIDELVSKSVECAEKKRKPKRVDFCRGAVQRCINTVSDIVEVRAMLADISPRFAAAKLVENDPDINQKLGLTENELEMVERSVAEMEKELDMDRNAAIADMRYRFIEDVCRDTVVKSGESKERIRSLKIDRVLTNKYLAIPIFLCIMLLVFWITFGSVGVWLSDLFTAFIDFVISGADKALAACGTAPIVHSLIINGIFAGVGSVLGFLPTIVTLFFCLSILEDSGYMARVAFVMDKLLRRIGLSGRSVVPMLIGFGCSVPAIMATRTLASERDRRMTVFLTPYMSCSAKLPIYAVFTSAFFPKYKAIVMLILYVGGMLAGIVCGMLMNKTAFKGSPVPFVLELPNYRLPSAKSVGLLMWDRAKDFIEKAFTVIFFAAIIIWFLQSFDLRLAPVGNSSESLLAKLGILIAPLFGPLGFDDWRAVTALITGFSAKEAVVSTLAVLTGSSVSDLGTVLTEVFTPVSAASFLAFTLLYTPCVAAVAAVKRELNGRSAFAMVLIQCITAWLSAFLVYTVGTFIFA